MIKVKSLLVTGEYADEYAYSVDEFLSLTAEDFGAVPVHEFRINKDGSKTVSLYNLPITFDIETSNIEEHSTPEEIQKKIKENRFNSESFMYIWQACVFGKVVFGRTWEDFWKYTQHIKKIFKIGQKEEKTRKTSKSNEKYITEYQAVVYVHNLSFEFQFVKAFLKIDDKDIFATDSHKVLYFKTQDGFEWRCSYRLTNMSLAKFIASSKGTVHAKGVGDLDYSVRRTSKTDLSEIEYGYCYNDVMGLYEAILSRLDVDSLKSIPYTSTGYVRRDTRKAMQPCKQLLKSLKVTPEIYFMLQEAFRGGNTASNALKCNRVIKDVGSYDITSSYPYVMIALAEYPVTPFKSYKVKDGKDLVRITKEKTTLARYTFHNLSIKRGVPIPYIASSKCLKHFKAREYNGRIITSDELQITLTNIDFEIICKQYDFDTIDVEDMLVAEKGRLPQEMRDLVYSYFLNKSQYKHVDDYAYATAKALLNATYGNLVTSLDKIDYILDENSGEWTQATFENDKEYQEFLKKAINNAYEGPSAYTAFQWGVWVSALARKRLQEMIDIVGNDVIYCDTDSVKMEFPQDHKAEFEQKNREVIEKANTEGIKITATNEKTGEMYFLGTWDNEGDPETAIEYDEFITMGAKKYAYKIGGKIGVTVAGLGKKQGAKELEELGGLEAFKRGTVFHNSGRTTAYWNWAPIHIITVDGVEMTTAASVGIFDTTYTLGITDTMSDIIDEVQEKGGF